MKQNKPRGQWAGSSHLTEKINDLRAAHEEFLKVKNLFDDGWKVKSAKVKRPRIHKTPTPKRIVVAIGDWFTMTVDFQDWRANGSVGRIIKEL